MHACTHTHTQLHFHNTLHTVATHPGISSASCTVSNRLSRQSSSTAAARTTTLVRRSGETTTGGNQPTGKRKSGRGVVLCVCVCVCVSVSQFFFDRWWCWKLHNMSRHSYIHMIVHLSRFMKKWFLDRRERKRRREGECCSNKRNTVSRWRKR